MLFSQKRSLKSSKNLFPIPDRYVDTHQSGIGINAYTDDKVLESGIGNSEENWGENAAPVIFKILSKLEMHWMEGPYIERLLRM